MNSAQDELLEKNLQFLQVLKKSQKSKPAEVNTTDTMVLIKATLEAMKIFDANNTCMTVEECADFLNIHKNTVKARIHKDKIKAEFIGRTWRIPKLQFVDEILVKEF